ncbi:MAG TPA: GNAT family acetyltransferase [Verrucomicrobiales bacterium]|jgi:ribosomal protein S18 acetylase RimI-like enzyme|nr:GNAT family acetyltransferase [Verrucomicrobiales bacterium]
METSSELPEAAFAGIRLYDDPSDRAQVMTLWKSIFGYETAHNSPALSIDRKVAVQDGLFFVAVTGGEVIGTTMAGYDGHRGWIYSVAVHPGHRKQGLGTRLVARAEQALSALGCVKINLQILEGNADVTAFYSSLGYAVEARINMGKRLPENVPNE